MSHMEIGKSKPVCVGCDRTRSLKDWLNYSPIQVVLGMKLGWYSGDDGEVCGPCMTKILKGDTR